MTYYPVALTFIFSLTIFLNYQYCRCEDYLTYRSRHPAEFKRRSKFDELSDKLAVTFTMRQQAKSVHQYKRFDQEMKKINV